MPKAKLPPVRNGRETGDGARNTWTTNSMAKTVVPKRRALTPDCRARTRSGPRTSQKAKKRAPAAPAVTGPVQSAASGPANSTKARAGRAGTSSLGRNSGRNSSPPKQAVRVSHGLTGVQAPAWPLPANSAFQPGQAGVSAVQKGMIHRVSTKKSSSPTAARVSPADRRLDTA